MPAHLKWANFKDDDQYLPQYYDQSLCWDDIKWLKSITSLPIILKGLLRSDDAQKGLKIDSQTVRNIKAGISKNILVFTTIIEIAHEYKQLSDQLKNSLKKGSVSNNS